MGSHGRSRPGRGSTAALGQAVAGVVVLLGVLAVATPAAAHVGPDPNLNNRYLKLDVSQDSVRFVYTLYFGDAPALEARAQMDSSRDGVLDDAEQTAFARRAQAEVLAKVRLEIDGVVVPVDKAEASVGLGQAVTRAGSFSVDLVLRAPLRRMRSHSLYVDHSFEPDLPGETELFVQAEPGLRVVASHIGRHGQGVTSQFLWRGSAELSGEDRSVTVAWLDDAAPEQAAGRPGSGATRAGGAGGGAVPWWLGLSHRADLGAAGALLMMVIALILGALDAVAPARLAALTSDKVQVSPIADALARTLVVGIAALPVARLFEQLSPPRALGLAAAGVMAAIGIVTLALARRTATAPLPAGADALKTAVRSPAVWGAMALAGFAARAPMAILLCALFAGGNLLASALLATPESRSRLTGDGGDRTRRAAVVASGAAILVFGLGLLALAARLQG